VRADGKTPPGLPELKNIKTIPYNFAEAANNKDAYVKKFTEIRMELGL
jgi:hypothetical protein